MDMKRWKSMVLLAFCLCFFPGLAYAEEGTAQQAYIGQGDLQKGQIAAEKGLDLERESRNPQSYTLEEAYREAVRSRQTYLDVSAFSIPVSQVNQILSQVRNAFPELFYATPARYRYSPTEQIVYGIEIAYTAGEEEVFAYEAAVAEALSWLEEDMTDVHKALVLHDYLALNCAYDQENFAAGTLPDTAYQSYGAMVLGSAVCQGYALAYQDLLTRAGISCFTVGSEGMNHAWNMVELDGEYYHVDVTWDDPVWDVPGQVLHENFLLSDSAVGESGAGHWGWDADVTADSEQYRDGFWTDAMAGIFAYEGNFYYLDVYGNLKSRTRNTGEEKLLTTIRERWPAKAEGPSYLLCYAKLLLLNEKLYYTTPEAVCSIELDGSDHQVLQSVSDGEKFIYGLALDGEELIYIRKETPSEQSGGSAGTVDGFSYLISEIQLSESALSLKEGEEAWLYALTLPNRRLGKNLIWTAANEAVASAESGGKVTAKSGGQTTLTAVHPASGQSASCGIQVEHQGRKSVVEREANCTQKGSLAYRCTGCNALLGREEIPVNEAHSFGEWKTERAATIFQEGLQARTCVRCGTRQTQTIAKKEAKVKLNASSVPLKVKTSTKAVKIKSQTAGDRVSSWSSSNAKVVSVNRKNGKITGKKTGTAWITVTMESGAKARCKVRVQKAKVKTKGLKLPKKRVTLKRKESMVLRPERRPVTGTGKIRYQSSNPKVAKVNQKGVIKAVKKGKAVITVRVSGGKKAVCKVTVKS